MGWASGSELFGDIAETLKDEIPKKGKKRVYEKLIKLFQMADCDTLRECEGIDPELDKALKGAGEILEEEEI